ncbi:SDR family oxidoreductase [Acidiferrimicrobium sp. IK]|uniref:SDR family NAD(P)-dependent oxidoreductase n=1 Tax=Acidiferrimicrobium sp. IK TaxID=2871700 RepID=UPI0021CB51F1|nr:SDR family oxidoreductase [Acidiferrimicrobium sp. IK]MCU4184957.1 SDR family oxidoreductase [Acidiferrimicrobium sp. IK]
MSDVSFNLEGKTALVIGAASGIGQEAAGALASHGARVVFADRNLDGADAAARAAGAGHSAVHLDVLDDSSIASAAARLPVPDVLVFTAATNVRKRILDYDLAEFDRVVALNLRASFNIIRSFGGPMCERGSGSIIGFGSIRAVTVEPGQAVYAATKAGLVQLARTAAAEFGPDGVRVNVVSPGVVDTPLTSQIRSDPDWYGAYAAKTALGRWARAEELAGAVVYLASDASSYVTGSVLTVDGGWTAIDGRYDPPNG